ncbi:biotin/lipoyl-containing protein, partial [Streptomyces sp. URMC 124]|uniref:ATP-binding protein n=1 Tax=Streptomyces sp. URMC 124 TaxID=3423405 RepID=UPI003F19AABA
MRIVRDAALLEAAMASARAEAMAAFGDDEVFVEPYVEGGRHVEVQILADAHGTVWELGTRDCSLQRRHQKVIEESPAPGLSEELRAGLAESAVAAARAVGYVGAGTVEFLVKDGRAYFLEMNTRLQVEHPVTEAVYGLDLVALQLRVAEGAALEPEPPVGSGHAVEARLYAEDPAAGWRPQVGTVRELSVAMPHPHRTARLGRVRVDAGVAPGDTVTPYYDPLLAKVIAWAPTRPEAVRLLARALERARIHGPVTNRELLVRSLRHEEFATGRMDTAFYERHVAALTATAPQDDGAATAALAAAVADAQGRSRFGGWRNLASQPQEKRYRSEPDGTEHTVRYRLTRNGLETEGASGIRLVEACRERVVLEAGNRVRTAYDVAVYGDRVHVDSPLGAHAFTLLPRFPDPAAVPAAPGSLLAPMPGTVVRLADGVAEGCPVEAGQPLLWLEAMKMEHRVVAPSTGTLTALHAAPGRQVEVGTLLAVVTEEPKEPSS